MLQIKAEATGTQYMLFSAKQNKTTQNQKNQQQQKKPNRILASLTVEYFMFIPGGTAG